MDGTPISRHTWPAEKGVDPPGLSLHEGKDGAEFGAKKLIPCKSQDGIKDLFGHVRSEMFAWC